MTINIGDRPEILSQLVGRMGQGGTGGNFANYGGLAPPKQADIAAFRAAAQPSGLQQTRDGDAGQPGSFVDGVGNSKATAALPEVYNASNAQQADKAGHNVPVQNGDNDVKKAGAGDAGSAEDKAKAAALDDEKQKQGEISSLISRIQMLQQQLHVIDSRGGASAGDGQAAGQVSPERTALVSLIQQLQNQLQVLQSS